MARTRAPARRNPVARTMACQRARFRGRVKPSVKIYSRKGRAKFRPFNFARAA